MYGLRIVAHPLAREVRDEWRVEAMPIRKRRNNWRVVKHRIDRPGMYQVGNTIYAHPEIVEQLRRAVPNVKCPS